MQDIPNIDEQADLLSRIADRIGSVATAARSRSHPPAEDPADAPADSHEWKLPGIHGATRVTTNFGHVPAHLVRPRDNLKVRSGGYLPVLHIDEYKLDEDFLRRSPDAQPVLFRKGTLSEGVPSQDVCVSPVQDVIVPTAGRGQVPVPASNVSRDRQPLDRSLRLTSYFVFHLPETAFVRCDGVWVHMASA